MRFVATTLLCSLLASPTLATEILYEGFNYTVNDPPQLLDGSVHTSGNTWLPPVSPPGDYTRLATGTLSYPDLEAATGNSALVPRAFATDPGDGNFGNGELRLTLPGQPYNRSAGGSFFFSFVLELDTWVGLSDGDAKNEANRRGGFIGGFFGAVASTTTSMQLGQSFAAPIYLRREIDYSVMGDDSTLGDQTEKFEIGVQKRATPFGLFDPEAQNSRGVVYDESVSFGLGESVLIVGQYDFVDTTTNTFGDIARLWINPTPGDLDAEATPSAEDIAENSPNMAGSLPIASFHIRNDTITPGHFLMDEIRVGTTFADVIPAAEEGLDGDFNGDELVDGSDFLKWQRGESPNGLTQGDLQLWEDGMTAATTAAAAVPEPSTWALGALAALVIGIRRRFVI